MIKDLSSVSLLDLLPANLLADEQVNAAVRALDGELQKVTTAVQDVLFLPRLDNLPESVLDLLAWQWHVDFYEPIRLDVETKRRLVRQSIAWHRHKGTPWAVEEVIKALLKGAVVRENWEYGGRPYCFQVALIEGAIASEETIGQAVKAIAETKNARSHLDGISFIRRIEQKFKFWGATEEVRRITVSPMVFQPPKINQKFYWRASLGEVRSVTVTQRISNLPGMRCNMNFRAGIGILKEVTVSWRIGQD